MLWVLFLIICCIIFYIIKSSFYWANKGVMHITPWEMWKYNLITTLQLKSTSQLLLDLHNTYKNDRYIGTYQFFQQILVIKDPNLIKQIGIKDFDHFVDHQQFVQEETEPLWGKGLFLLTGERWKDMRSTLSPSFTSSKMRGMFELINESTEQFLKYLQKKESSSIITIELKDAFTRFATDVTATAAFGLSCDSLTDPNNEFYLMGQELTDLSGFWKNLGIVLLGIAPRIANFFGITFTSPRAGNFFRNLVKSTVESRERNSIVRPDMIHLLMEARKGTLKHDNNSNAIDSGFAVIQESAIDKETRRRKLELTNEDLTAQALLFFFAGVDAVSTLMCFSVYELAVNYEIQKRLQEEVDDVLRECEGVVTYESLLKMKYLDMVVSETLRKWPSTVTTDRVCVKPYVIKPIKEEKPVQLNVGDLVWLPSYSIHHDPDLYPEPDRFDPERFSEENKSNIQPHTYLPFGIGPRSCIGNRFALLESKLLIFKLLAHYNFVVVEKTQIPMKLLKNNFTLTAENGFWVGFERRGTK